MAFGMIIIMMMILFLMNSFEAQVCTNKEQKNCWALRMVHNVRWNVSKSYLAVQIEDAHGQKEHLGERVMSGYEGAKMSFFYGLNYDNMLIQFHTYKDTGAAYCEIGVITEEAEKEMSVAFAQAMDYKERQCNFERKKPYVLDGDVVNKKKFTAFCPIKPENEVFKWIIANGTFNRPTRAPQCLYDFYTAARTVSFEYELFRYCAKGYFFNGKDYDEPHPDYRKDWLLYLAEGSVTCGISGNSEEDKSLLAKGYTVELVHRFDFDQINEHNGMTPCPHLEAILTSYHDKDPEGRFFFAAVVGPGQLDGHFQWSDRPGEEKRFWDEETYKEEYKTMTLGERGCYLHYHSWARMPKSKRFYLELRVTHYCTGRAMRDSINFDVSIARENAPEGIYEDRGIAIDLSAKTLRRTTGQTLCAKEMSLHSHQPFLCVQPPHQTLERKLLGQDCDQKQSQCPFGASCTIPVPQPSCRDTNRSCTLFYDNSIECGDCQCTEMRPKRADESCRNYHLLDCAEHKFCVNGECRKKRYKELDEPCWSSAECFPGFVCSREETLNHDVGTCTDREVEQYRCFYPYQWFIKTCKTPCCPKDSGAYWSECQILILPASDDAEGAGCKKRTWVKQRKDTFRPDIEDCGTSQVRYLCCG